MSELNTTSQKPSTKRKDFTPADIIANQNLRQLWQSFRARSYAENEEAMTQEKAAKLMDWTQSNFSQYLNGIVPIGFKAAQKLSTLFGCKVSDIRPDYKEIDEDSQASQRDQMLVMLKEMREIIEGIRTGETDAATAHQKVEKLEERVIMSANTVENSPQVA